MPIYVLDGVNDIGAFTLGGSLPENVPTGAMGLHNNTSSGGTVTIIFPNDNEQIIYMVAGEWLKIPGLSGNDAANPGVITATTCATLLWWT